MKTPYQVRSQLRAKLLRNWKPWLLASVYKEPFSEIIFNLRTTAVQATEDFNAFEKNEREWKKVCSYFGETLPILRLTGVKWREFGKQEMAICDSVSFTSPEAILRFVGDSILIQRWNSSKSKLTSLRPSRKREFLKRLLNESELLENPKSYELSRLLGTVDYLKFHRDANRYIREIPIPGIDTKWLTSNLKTVCDLLSIELEEDITKDELFRRWNIKLPPLFVPIKNPRAFFMGLASVPLVSLPHDTLLQPPEKLVIVENLQTGLALPDFGENTPIIMGLGFGIKKLSELPWISKVPIVYFGDLDRHGLKILSLLREFAPQTKSVLTNLETFNRFRDFSVADPTNNLSDEYAADTLNAEEAELLDFLNENRLRLEQERIPMHEIIEAMEKALRLEKTAQATECEKNGWEEP